MKGRPIPIRLNQPTTKEESRTIMRDIAKRQRQLYRISWKKCEEDYSVWCELVDAKRQRSSIKGASAPAANKDNGLATDQQDSTPLGYDSPKFAKNHRRGMERCLVMCIQALLQSKDTSATPEQVQLTNKNFLYQVKKMSAMETDDIMIIDGPP